MDNLTAKWLMRHFYFLFFQVVLVVIFFFWLFNTIRVIDTSFQVSKSAVLERILMTQSVNTSIIVILLLLNSFWLLFIFNSIQRLSNLLKDISYNINRLRVKGKTH